MYGEAPPNDVPAHGQLTEPRSADRYVRGRSRLTVRELMAQMNAEDAGPDERPTRAVPVAPVQRSSTRRSSIPQDDGHPADDSVTQAIPTIKDAPAEPGVDLSDDATARRVIEESRAQESHAPDASDGEVPAALVGAQVAPLQRTPDLTDAIPKVTSGRRRASDSAGARPGPRRHQPSTPADRRRGIARSATVTGRILVTIACVTALVGTGFVWGYLKSWNGNWKTIAALNSEDSNIRNKDAQYGDENYLIVGTDTRTGKNSTVGAGTVADAEGARSDTVILVNIPANRSRVVAVSFPRDLQVDRPECQTWDNNSGTYSGELPGADGVKLNSVYADGGPKCLVKVITEMSGLNINHFIAMDFYGFEKVVRSIGGVEVCSTTPLYDYELGQILRKPGKQKLTGKRALNYVRARNISTEGNGDYGRIKRQQLFMSSLLRSTLSGNVMSNPTKLNGIVNTFIDYSFVDGVDTQSLLRLAESMQGIEAGRVTFLTIPTAGTTTDGSNNEIPRTDDINAIFNAIIDDKPLPGEKRKKAAAESTTSSSAPTSTKPAGPTKVSATAQNPGNVGVRVLNGTGRAGTAAETASQLSPYGFDVRGVADASENRDTTVVRYGTGEQNSAATLAAMFPGASIQLDRTVKSGVEVILGSDFSGSPDSPPAPGSTLSTEQLPQASNTSNLPNDLAVTNAGDATCT